MNNQSRRVFWSVLLIIFGFFFLLNNFRIFGDLSDLFWAGVFGVGAFLGLGQYLKRPEQWWVLFPTGVFLGIAGAITLDTVHLFPHTDSISGSFFMLSLALPFWIIFIREVVHWWAAIPGGVLTTLAMTIAVDDLASGDMAGSLFFIGLGLTFGLLWLNRATSHTDWAKWPATILIGFGLFVSVAPYFDRAWPLVLIAVGLWMLGRNSLGRGNCCKKRIDAPAINLDGAEDRLSH